MNRAFEYERGSITNVYHIHTCPRSIARLCHLSGTHQACCTLRFSVADEKSYSPFMLLVWCDGWECLYAATWNLWFQRPYIHTWVRHCCFCASTQSISISPYALLDIAIQLNTWYSHYLLLPWGLISRFPLCTSWLFIILIGLMQLEFTWPHLPLIN